MFECERACVSARASASGREAGGLWAASFLATGTVSASGVPAERGRSRSSGSESRRVINQAGACLAREDPPPWFGGPGTQREDTRERPWDYCGETRETADSPCLYR